MLPKSPPAWWCLNRSYSGRSASSQPAPIHHPPLSLAISVWRCFKAQNWLSTCLFLGLGGSAARVQARRSTVSPTSPSFSPVSPATPGLPRVARGQVPADRGTGSALHYTQAGTETTRWREYQPHCGIERLTCWARGHAQSCSRLRGDLSKMYSGHIPCTHRI